MLGSRTVSNARNISPFHACNLISYADNLVQGFRVIVYFTGFSIPEMFVKMCIFRVHCMVGCKMIYGCFKQRNMAAVLWLKMQP